jgi:hypothetical protein
MVLGCIEQAGDRFTAATIGGRELGVFHSLKAAADAVSAASGGGA